MKKKLSYWLIGGLIGLAFFIFLDILLPFICSRGYLPFFNNNPTQDCFVLVFPVFAFPYLMQLIFGVETLDFRFILILNIIIFILIGVVVGWIIGKIKRKQKN